MNGTLAAQSRLARDLSACALFSQCTPEQLAFLASQASVHEGSRCNVIANGDQQFPYLGFVRYGVIGVTATADWQVRGGVRRLRLYEARAGATFCEVAFLDGHNALGEISVVSKRAGYALIPVDAIHRVAEENALFFKELAVQGAVRCREVKRRLLTQATRPVGTRLANVLLPFAVEGEGLQRASNQLAEFTQLEIAAATGCVKETAARAIAELEAAGAIRRERGHIRYIDRQVLLRYSDPIPPLA